MYIATIVLGKERIRRYTMALSECESLIYGHRFSDRFRAGYIINSDNSELLLLVKPNKPRVKYYGAEHFSRMTGIPKDIILHYTKQLRKLGMANYIGEGYAGTRTHYWNDSIEYLKEKIGKIRLTN